MDEIADTDTSPGQTPTGPDIWTGDGRHWTDWAPDLLGQGIDTLGDIFTPQPQIVQQTPAAPTQWGTISIAILAVIVVGVLLVLIFRKS